MRVLKDKKLAIFFSIGLHVIIFSLLFIKLPHSHPRLAKNVNVIQAVAVTEPSHQGQAEKEPSHVPMLSENTIRHIEQTALKQTESSPLPISKPLPEESAPPPIKELPPVKKMIEQKEPTPIQEPKIDQQAQMMAKQKLAEEKKRVEEEQRKEELKHQEAELAKKRRAQEAKQLQQELAAETKQQESKTAEESKATEETDANDDANEETQAKETKGDNSATTKTAAADDSGEIDKYKQMIIQTISRKWILPEAVAENIACQLLVHLGPGGVVISVDVLKESGDINLDRSARNAIMKASPLPVPESADLFDNFRALRLTFRPEGIVSG